MTIKTKPTPLKRRIRNWLDQESKESVDITQKETDIFRLRVNYRTTPLLIIQPKGKQSIVIAALIRLTPEHLEIIRSSPKEDRLRVIKNLGNYIHERQLYCIFQFENEKEVIFQHLVIESSNLFKEDLTKTLFFRYLDFVRFGHVLVIEKFRSLIGADIQVLSK